MDRVNMEGKGCTLVLQVLLTHQYAQFPTAWASILLKSKLGLDILRNNARSVLPSFTKFPYSIDTAQFKAILYEIKEVGYEQTQGYQLWRVTSDMSHRRHIMTSSNL